MVRIQRPGSPPSVVSSTEHPALIADRINGGPRRAVSHSIETPAMAIKLKSPRQIRRLRESGRIVAETFQHLKESVVPGVTTGELDRICEEFIRARGAIPIYKGYGGRAGRQNDPGRRPFPASICVAIDSVVCHGIPSPNRELRDGEIVGIDIGLSYKGWVGDSCKTFAIGPIDGETQRLLDVTRQCLERGIEQVRPGARVGDIGAAIQQHAEGQGFSVVRELSGHGVGRSLHEEPTVLHYGVPGTGFKIRPGMVFTIEPMINAGAPEARLLEDGWTVCTVDGSRSAQFEHTIAVTPNGPQVLTQL